MKKIAWIVVFAILAGLLLVVSVTAQENPAAVRIADAAQPAGILVDPLDCLERAEKVFARKKSEKKAAEKAAEYCQKNFHEGGGIMKGVANEAADATKNNYPRATYGYGGYGYGGYSGYGGGWAAPGYGGGGWSAPR